MYIFLKDHLEHKEGDKVTEHANAQYLVRVGVIEEVKKAKQEEDDLPFVFDSKEEEDRIMALKPIKKSTKK